MVGYVGYLIWACVAVFVYRRFFQQGSPSRTGLLLLGVILATGFGWLAYCTHPPRHDIANDFRIYFQGGQDALTRPEGLVEGDYGFVNVPVIAFLFTPLGPLGASLAFKVFSLLGVIAAAAGYLVVQRIEPAAGWRARYWQLVALAGSGPLVHSLWYGNVSHLLLPVLALALLYLQRNRQVAGGALLALSGAIKLPLLLFAPFIFVRGKWVAVVAYAVTGLALLGASIALFGLQLHFEWLAHVGKFLGKVVPAYNVQSATGFLARLMLDTGGELLDWNLYEVTPSFKLVNTSLLLALVAAYGLTLWRGGLPRSPRALAMEFGATLCLALALSSLSWSHYYALVWLPLALLIVQWSEGRLSRAEAVALAVGGLLLSLPAVADPPPAALAWLDVAYRRLLVSHTFIGGVILYGLLLRRRLRETD